MMTTTTTTMMMVIMTLTIWMLFLLNKAFFNLRNPHIEKRQGQRVMTKPKQQQQQQQQQKRRRPKLSLKKPSTSSSRRTTDRGGEGGGSESAKSKKMTPTAKVTPTLAYPGSSGKPEPELMDVGGLLRWRICLFFPLPISDLIASRVESSGVIRVYIRT